VAEIDQSEQPRFWIYVAAVAFLFVGLIVARGLAVFAQNWPLMLIPEASVLTTQFCFVLLLVYLHWPLGEDGMHEYVDVGASDVGEGKGGDSLFE